jgi:Uri superfamily endonuclease
VKGSYILVMQLERPLEGLAIGRLGHFDFAAGFYLYVGSAYGSGGLAARLAHHQRRLKARPHWHIDYLRGQARLREAWSVAGPRRMECAWCEALAAHPAVSAPVPGFGSSDTNCGTHLFYLPRPPHPSLLTGVILGAVVADTSTEIQIEIHSFDDL